MKFLFLNGSPRKDSYTKKVMQVMISHLENVDTELINICEHTIKGCISCMACRPNGICQLPPDDGHSIASKIKRADALIIGSPTYFGNVSGQLKLLIDRSITAFETIAASGLEMPIPHHTHKAALMITACNVPSVMSRSLQHAGGTLNAMQSVLNAGGYTVLGEILLDNAASLDRLPHEIVKEAKALAQALEAF